MPLMPPTVRLALLGCALAASAALLLAGCGDGSSATADRTASTQAKSEASAEAAAPMAGCPRQVDAFVASLDALRRQLAIGLSYEQYAARVKFPQAAYGEVPVDHLSIGCLTTTGTPSERALNRYIDAANVWGACLADAACETATIEPVLQRKWRVASRHLGEVE
jgi:hypothetical protein